MKIYRFYSKVDNNTARVSVVGTYSEGILKLAVSRCSTKDPFIKKKGRSIAEGRLLKGKIFKEILLDNITIESFVNIAKEVADEVSTTKRVS